MTLACVVGDDAERVRAFLVSPVHDLMMMLITRMSEKSV